MRVFKPLLTAAALAVLAAPSLAVLAAPTAASADPAWGGHDHGDWREQGVWRDHEWREHAWREAAWRRHEWREHHPWTYKSVYRSGWNEYRRASVGRVIVIHHGY